EQLGGFTCVSIALICARDDLQSTICNCTRKNPTESRALSLFWSERSTMRTVSSLCRMAVVCVCLASVVVVSAGRAAATDCSPTSKCTVFLPVVQPTPFVPLLDEPANGAQIISVAPLLTWTPTISSTYQVQVSETSTFSTTQVNATDP